MWYIPVEVLPEAIYEVGMLTARKGSNLLDPASWSNSPRSWMNNGSPVSQVGPGHNSFVKDEYGGFV